MPGVSSTRPSSSKTEFESRLVSMSSTAHLHCGLRATKNATSRSPTPYVPRPESFVLPDHPVREDATEPLNEFVHDHPNRHGTEETLIGSDNDQGASDDEGKVDRKFKLPWWKRPSPWWLLALMPFTSIAMSATIAPRIEIYTMLACSVHKPDVFRQNIPGIELDLHSAIHETSGLHFQAPFPNIPTSSNIYVAHVLPGTYYFLDRFPKDGPKPPPKKENLCASDPVVQAAVAKLTTVITACTGVLSCITTGWWGAFSDRHGRTRVMGISVLGLLLTDFNFIFVTLFSKHIPGGYWFFVTGPIGEGLLGGMSTGAAAYRGYLADTTNESNRSRLFSLSLGLLFIGMAIGPTFGSLLIRLTGNTLFVFFAATTIHIFYTLFVWFILPESLSKKQMEKTKRKYAADLLVTANEREQNPAVGLLVKLRHAFTFLSPLTIFMPPEEQNDSSNPLKKLKIDWNLTLMALGYAFTVSLEGSYSYKLQYAASALGWDSQTIGYWLSLIGATRAIFLTLILPVAIKLFKPEPIILDLLVPTTPRETTPLLGSNTNDSGSQAPSSSFRQASKTVKKEIHSLLFDLNLARVSLFVEIIVHVFTGLSPTATAFTLFGMMESLGEGFSPAFHSVTVALYTRRGGTETGRLFGALGVVQALSSQILGPLIYGFVYVKTVAAYPCAIFFVSVATVSVSLVLLSLVRLPNASEYHRQGLLDLEELTLAVDYIQEGTLVDLRDARPEPGED